MLRFLILAIALQSELSLYYYESKGDYKNALREAYRLYSESKDPYFLEKTVIYSNKLKNKFLTRKYCDLYLKKFGFKGNVVAIYVDVLLKDGKKKRAKRILDALSQESESQAFSNVLGRLYLKCGYPKIAKKFLLIASEVYPDSEEIKFSLAVALEKEGDLDGALQILESLGEDEKILLKKADILIRTGEKDEALKIYEKLLSDGKSSYTLYLNLSRLYLDKNDIESAIKILSILKKVYPYDYKIQSLYAYALYRQNRHTEALDEYLRLSALFEHSAEAHYYIARILNAMGAKKDALQEINRAIEISDTYEYRLYRVYLLIENNKLDDASLELLRLKSQGSNDPYYNYLCAFIFQSSGKSDLAYRYFKSSLTLDSTNVKRYLDFVEFLVQNEKQDEASAVLLRGVKFLKVKDRENIFKAALLGQETKNYELAESLYTVLLSLDSSNPIYYNNLGFLLVEAGKDLERAKELIEKALEMDPQNPLFLDSMGWLYFKEGVYERAALYIEKAVELDGGKNKEILKHAIEVEKRLNNLDKLEKYKKMLESGK